MIPRDSYAAYPFAKEMGMRQSLMALRLRISRSTGLVRALPYSWAEQAQAIGLLQ